MRHHAGDGPHQDIDGHGKQMIDESFVGADYGKKQATEMMSTHSRRAGEASEWPRKKKTIKPWEAAAWYGIGLSSLDAAMLHRYVTVGPPPKTPEFPRKYKI